MTLFALLLSVLANDLFLLRTSTLRIGYPQPVYGLYSAAGTSPEPGMPGAAGIDFSQVQTSAMALRHGESAYNPTTPEFRDRGTPSALSAADQLALRSPIVSALLSGPVDPYGGNLSAFPHGCLFSAAQGGYLQAFQSRISGVFRSVLLYAHRADPP